MAISRILSKTEIEGVYSAANSAIWHSHHSAGSASKKVTREEDYVAELVRLGIPFLADRLESILQNRGLSIRVSGVFCHGHPRVRFSSARTPIELADLLVVHQHAGINRTTARAMLVQAKMSTDATHRLSSSDDQLKLFSSWLKFEFVSGGLKPGLRELNEVGKGSRYALVLKQHAFPEDISWPEQCPWAASPAVQLLSAEASFARLIGNMVLGKDGRSVNLYRPKDDWSKTIKELLEITGQRTFKRANIGLDNTSRLTTGGAVTDALLFSQSKNFLESSSRSRRKAVVDSFFRNGVNSEGGGTKVMSPQEREVEDPEGGISALIIETQETDQRLEPE